MKHHSALQPRLSRENVDGITAELNVLCADVLALYIKTKNFHWHVSGPHFRDYHRLLDEQAEHIFAMIDAIAERVRKMGRDDDPFDWAGGSPEACSRQ